MQTSIEVDAYLGQRPGGLPPSCSQRPSMLPSTWDPRLGLVKSWRWTGSTGNGGKSFPWFLQELRLYHSEEDSSDELSDNNESSKDSEDEEAMLSRRLQRILAKKKKFQSGRRHFKKHKEFKKSEGKDQKTTEPICYECKKPGHIKAEYPKLKKGEYKKKDNFRKFRKYKKKAMAAVWENNSDSDNESTQSSEGEEEANLAFMANTDEKAITLRPRHRPPPDLKPSTSPARNFLRVSPSTILPDLQNLSLLDSMASIVVSGSIGGYGAAFLTTDEQARFASVKTKLCKHKAVDLADLEKNGMGSLIEALQRLKWMKIATLSDVSHPDLVKAFYVCLKTEEDETLTSMVKGTQIRITRELLASLFEVSTSGRSGVYTVDTHVKGLGIIGPEYRLKDGKLDINQLSTFNRLLHFIICQIIVPRSATFSSCTKVDSDLMFWAIQNQEINTAELIIERMRRKTWWGIQGVVPLRAVKRRPTGLGVVVSIEGLSYAEHVLSISKISGLMQSEVEEDHVFPSRSPLLQCSKLAAHDPNLKTWWDPGCCFPSVVKEDLVGSRVLFPFSCEGRPGGVSRVLLFPSGVKEDQLS
ncbi:hypothetical protein Taro_049837 [Colocasia esculenta]|uniref:Putative plant transposon protein domain-containing protein n=1 Tax=Colocasia esculenta TaxID=4460 RepID=A0A843XCC1_COLES|nr:hypothetical protein [Colocasia esculenta]